MKQSQRMLMDLLGFGGIKDNTSNKWIRNLFMRRVDLFKNMLTWNLHCPQWLHRCWSNLSSKYMTLANRPYCYFVPPHQSSACVCTRLCCGSMLVGGCSVCLWNWGNLQEHKLNNKKLWINHEVTNLGLKAEGRKMEQAKKKTLPSNWVVWGYMWGEDKSEGCKSIHPINQTQKDTKPHSPFTSLLNLTGCCSLFGHFLDLKPNVKVQSEFQIRLGDILLYPRICKCLISKEG